MNKISEKENYMENFVFSAFVKSFINRWRVDLLLHYGNLF